jgi:EAL domain-containing protein (putative c-di-GMP-specific phosphodiesterase class I)
MITPSGQIKWLQGQGNSQAIEHQTIVWDAVMVEVTEQKLTAQGSYFSQPLSAKEMTAWLAK